MKKYIKVGKYIEVVFPSYNIRFIAINDNIDSYKDHKYINNFIVPFKWWICKWYFKWDLDKYNKKI